MRYALTQDMLFQRARIYNYNEIKKINFMGYAFNDISEISKCINLESVSFSSNQITSLKYFNDMKNLRELSLANNNISDINEIRYLSSCPNLKKLWLKGNPISRFQEYREYVIKLLPNLEKLDDKEVTVYERQMLNMNNMNNINNMNNYPLQQENRINIMRRNSYENSNNIKNIYKKQMSSPINNIPNIQNGQEMNNFHYQQNYGNYNNAYNNGYRNERGRTPIINHNQNMAYNYMGAENYNNYNDKYNNYYKDIYSKENSQYDGRYKRQVPHSSEGHERNYRQRRMDDTVINGQQGIIDCIGALLKRLEKDELKYILKHIDKKLAEY